jgi:hypothetical protein
MIINNLYLQEQKKRRQKKGIMGEGAKISASSFFIQVRNKGER